MTSFFRKIFFKLIISERGQILIQDLTPDFMIWPQDVAHGSVGIVSKEHKFAVYVSRHFLLLILYFNLQGKFERGNKRLRENCLHVALLNKKNRHQIFNERIDADT